jgi:hypothetical protein
MDMSDCPADFRVAYRQHIRAWQGVQAEVQQLPEGFLDGIFMGALNAILRGEVDGGTSRLENNLKQATQELNRTWEEVERVGAKYGAAL